MREIVFDTETTGLDPLTGDRMVEIGCVELIDRMPTGATFHAYFNPERDMPAGAEAVHGLSAAFLADKPRFGESVEELLTFLQDSKLVAHNASFDFGFLNFELEQCGLQTICLSRMVDTVAIARKRHPGAKLSLDALCTRYGIDRSHRVKHGALLDAELLAQVYLELNGGRQIGLELATRSRISQSAAPESPVRATGQRREPRHHGPNPSELQRHADFLARIEKPLWLA